MNRQRKEQIKKQNEKIQKAIDENDNKEGSKLKQLLAELNESRGPGDSKGRAEDILEIIKKREYEKELDRTLDRHATLLSKVFLNKIFISILNNK